MYKLSKNRASYLPRQPQHTITKLLAWLTPNTNALQGVPNILTVKTVIVRCQPATCIRWVPIVCQHTHTHEVMRSVCDALHVTYSGRVYALGYYDCIHVLVS